MREDIAFKGIRQGILVTLPEEDEWAKISTALASRIDQQSGFFDGATMVLQVNRRAIRQHELASLLTLLEKRNVKLIGVLSTSATTQGATRKLGLVTDLEDLPAETHPMTMPEAVMQGDNGSGGSESERAAAPAMPSEVQGTQGILIPRTLRSGKRINSEGHVVILGDVNAGAEVVAAGDIVVWGRVRGVVHAGADGDESCVVCALDLQPTQLRIASYITVSPSGKRRKPRPERAFVENGQIRAETWKA